MDDGIACGEAMARIVGEALKVKARVAGVARRYGSSANQPLGFRRLARDGRPVGAASETVLEAVHGRDAGAGTRSGPPQGKTGWLWALARDDHAWGGPEARSATGTAIAVVTNDRLHPRNRGERPSGPEALSPPGNALPPLCRSAAEVAMTRLPGYTG